MIPFFLSKSARLSHIPYMNVHSSQSALEARPFPGFPIPQYSRDKAVLKLAKDPADSIPHSVTTKMDPTRSERTYRSWLDAATDGEIPRSVPPKADSPELRPSPKRAKALRAQILTDHHTPSTDEDLRTFEKFSNTPLPEPFRFYPQPHETPAQIQNGEVLSTQRHGALLRSNAVSKRSSQISELNSEQRAAFERVFFYSQGCQSVVPKGTAKSDCGPNNSLQSHLPTSRVLDDVPHKVAKSELGLHGYA